MSWLLSCLFPYQKQTRRHLYYSRTVKKVHISSEKDVHAPEPEQAAPRVKSNTTEESGLEAPPPPSSTRLGLEKGNT